MARSYGRVDVMIWRDADFRALNEREQRLYLVLISQPQINNCGVLPFTPRRWASLAGDSSLETVLAGLAALVTARFLVVDEESEELLVRTYVKHDKIEEQPNLEKAAKREFQAIESARIRFVLQKHYPSLFGEPERSLPEGVSEAFADDAEKGSPRAEPLALSPTPKPATSSPSPVNGSTNVDVARDDRLPFEKQQEILRMLSRIDDADDRTPMVVQSLALPLPLGSLVKVRESVERHEHVGAGYVVNALKSEREEQVA